MAPKKKKGTSKKAGKKKKEKTPKVVEPLSDQTKEFYLLQITDLEKQVIKYQQKCDNLEVKNTRYNEQFEQMLIDKHEIISSLKKTLDQKMDELADLNDRLIGLQQVKDTEKDHYEQLLQQLRNEFQETKDQLTSDNMILSSKLSSLEEFRVQRDHIRSKMAEMEEELKKKDQILEDEIYRLEKKQVIDKDRLKKEMILRVNQVAAEFRKVSNRQMAETTKRTIRENVAMTSQLNKMSDKTMELIDETDSARVKEKLQKHQIELLEDNEKELLRKNAAHQQIIRMLADKCQSQELVINELQQREEYYHQLEDQLQTLQQITDSSRKETMNTAEKNTKTENDLKTVQEKLQEEQRVKNQLETLLYDATITLTKALAEPSTETQEQTRNDLILERNGVLIELQRLLNAAVKLGLVPDQLTSVNGGRTVFQPITSQSRQYHPGDLGLVPRQKLLSTKSGLSGKSATGQSMYKAELMNCLSKEESIKLPSLVNPTTTTTSSNH